MSARVPRLVSLGFLSNVHHQDLVEVCITGSGTRIRRVVQLAVGQIHVRRHSVRSSSVVARMRGDLVAKALNFHIIPTYGVFV